MSIYTTQLLRTPSTHSRSITAAFDSIWNSLFETVTACASSSVSQMAQSVIIRVLAHIVHGELRIVTPTGVLIFGKRDKRIPYLEAELRVRNAAFWTRVLLFSDLGFAEAFMYGDVECDDVPAFLRLMIANRGSMPIDSASFAASVLAVPRLLTSARFRGDQANSRANASAHYDLGNVLFSSFLSNDMNYSSAIFKDYTEDLHPHHENLESLEEAQFRKMRKIIARADIHEGHRVLEIGSGWGALAILAVQTTGCTVDTITLSVHQQTLAIERIEAAGLSDKIRVHLMDYRDCKLRPEWEHAFDRFVSVEMVENVGKEFIATFWGVVDWALKRTEAVGCVQVITIPESRVKEYDNKGVDFIQKWVLFPGGYIPSCAHLISTMASGSGGRLITESVSNIGPHYARTLREWKHNFLRNFNPVIAPALREEYQLSDIDVDIFQRKWIYYFDYCESGFATRILGDHVIAFTREGNVALGNPMAEDEL